MLVQDLTPWQDKLAVLTLGDGESTTVHILYVDSEYNDIIVDVLASNRPYPGSDHRAFAIPFGRILSVGPSPARLLVHCQWQKHVPLRHHPDYLLCRSRPHTDPHQPLSPQARPPRTHPRLTTRIGFGNFDSLRSSRSQSRKRWWPRNSARSFRGHFPCRRPYYFFWQKATSFPLELRKLTVGRPCGEWYME